MFGEILAQLADQFRVFGKTFHEDLTRTIEYGFVIGEAGIDIEIFFGLSFRI